MKEEEETLRGRNILIVDDDNRNTFALSSYLEQVGIQVHSAASGYESLEILNNNPAIELVLMDIMMPEMDGFETIQRIRSNFLLRDMPVIALTAKAMKGDREKCLDAGASDYVSKPVNMTDLLGKMAKLLNKNQW